MIEKIDIQKLKSLPIEGVAERLGLEVKRHRSLCPFHEDSHPSLSFHPRRNTYRCFVCGAAGDTIDLVMKFLKISFQKACRWLSEDNCILSSYQPTQTDPPSEKKFNPEKYEKFFRRPRLSLEAKRFLFEERKLHPQVIMQAGLTSWTDRQGVHWLEIPFRNIAGKLIGLQNRNLDYRPTSPGEKKHSNKFLFPAGSRTRLYNLPILKKIQPGQALYITEGCSDCWAMLSAGFPAIAVPSATLLKPDDEEELKQILLTRRPVLHAVPDRDTPGEGLLQQLQEIAPGLIVHRLPPPYKDYSEYFVQTRKEACHA